LTGGKTQSGPKSRQAIINSMLSILVSPEKLGTLDNFNAETGAFVRWAQSQTDALSPIRLAGDPERDTKRHREQDGIPIDPVTWDEVCQAGEDVGFKRVR
jgi:hydroxycarboxylate dehydrogenase B